MEHHVNLADLQVSRTHFWLPERFGVSTCFWTPELPEFQIDLILGLRELRQINSQLICFSNTREDRNRTNKTTPLSSLDVVFFYPLLLCLLIDPAGPPSTFLQQLFISTRQGNIALPIYSKMKTLLPWAYASKSITAPTRSKRTYSKYQLYKEHQILYVKKAGSHLCRFSRPSVCVTHFPVGSRRQT